MFIKTKKKILLIALPIFVLIAILMLIYWLSYRPKRVVNKLPGKEIISIVREPGYPNQESPKIELSQEKISLFFDLIKDLKCKKRFNLLGIMSRVLDDAYYIITYDNYIVRLSKHYLSVSNNNGEMMEEFQINEMKPNGVFDEIEKLFFGE